MRRLDDPQSPLAASSTGGSPLDSVFARRLAAARARWPAIGLAEETFRQHLAERAPADPAAVAALHLEDLYLACGCAHGDPAAHAALDAEVLSQVPHWLKRFGDVRAEDVQQDLRQRLLLGPEAHLLLYKGSGPLARWIQVTATRCAIDRRRRLKPADDEAVETLIAGPDPQIDFLKVHDLVAVRRVLHEAIEGLPSRELRLLRLHYLQSLSLDEMAELERVHRTTVARWLVGARAIALERVHALLRERLRVTQLEGESLLRMVRSRLELSLRGALQA